ncbi:MAG: hypothetical protein M3434_10245, partial [Gemmatimonadota bacterium]|nr:hypothetical protein [Gemmatimonadota bacterium]
MRKRTALHPWGIMLPSLLTDQRPSPRALQPRRRSAAPIEDQFALFQFSPEGALLLPELEA